jgi:hypothetical protein
MPCPSLDPCGNVGVAESLGMDGSVGEDVVSSVCDADSGTDVAEEAACESAVELAAGTGDSVLKMEVGPTGILPSATTSCPFCPLTSSSPCWLASVELENLEAILTCLY